MRSRLLSMLALIVVAIPSGAVAQTGRTDDGAIYFPGTTWRHRTPAESGIDAARLKAAIDFAVASETKAPRDLVMNHYQTFGREPFGQAIGPFKERGDPTGR